MTGASRGDQSECVTRSLSLHSLLADVVALGALSARGEPKPADAFIIALATSKRKDRSPALSYVRAVGENLAPMLGKESDGCKSTCL